MYAKSIGKKPRRNKPRKGWSVRNCARRKNERDRSELRIRNHPKKKGKSGTKEKCFSGVRSTTTILHSMRLSVVVVVFQILSRATVSSLLIEHSN